MAGRQDGRARHEQIAAILREQIMSEDLPPGSRLPSIQQLADQYGVAAATVQNTLGILRAEGFVRSEVGKGVFVHDARPFVVRTGAYFTPTPRGYSYRILDVAEVRPPAAVAAIYGLAPDQRAILRKRLMLHGGDPVSLFWSYYPLELAAGTPLAGRAKIMGGAPQVLDELGYRQTHFVDRVSARPPTPEELETLEIPEDMPVLRQFRVVYAGERPVEVGIQIKGAHKYELEYRETIEALDG